MKTFFFLVQQQISIDLMIVEEINPLVIEHLIPEIYQQQGMHCASSEVIMTAPWWTLMTTAETRLLQTKQRLAGGTES